MTNFREAVSRLLAGKEFIFRSDKLRRSIDGVSLESINNMDVSGRGPANRFYIGRKVAYPITDYLDWVCSRVKVA
jgi:hypothetical protein